MYIFGLAQHNQTKINSNCSILIYYSFINIYMCFYNVTFIGIVINFFECAWAFAYKFQPKTSNDFRCHYNAQISC